MLSVPAADQALTRQKRLEGAQCFVLLVERLSTTSEYGSYNANKPSTIFQHATHLDPISLDAWHTDWITGPTNL